jgi:ABC-type multidrug transport system ATPase subunit
LNRASILALDEVSKRFVPAGALERLLTLGRAPTREVLALDHVSLHVKAGEIVGLIGPNGSGKSTLLRCCAGLVRPSSGSLFVQGEDPTSDEFGLRGRIGLVMRDDRTFHLRMSGRDNLRLFARLQQIPKAARERLIEETLAQSSLSDVADQPYRTYSTGMKQRLAFARALLGRPILLLLDEASSGLDPGLRVSFATTLRAIAAEGVGVLFATHDLVEARQLCDRFVVLDCGRIIARGDWDAVAPRLGDVFGESAL